MTSLNIFMLCLLWFAYYQHYLMHHCFMVRNYFHSLHLISLLWIPVVTGSTNCCSELWPSCCKLFFILLIFYCLLLELFLLISHFSLFPPLAHFAWWVSFVNGSLICQTALCFLEHICASQPVNCWILHRVVAELACIFASELNQEFFSFCWLWKKWTCASILYKGIAAF